ncbi:MAG: hypothetical protein AAF732_19200 [Pseudomonadota bacterium]
MLDAAENDSVLLIKLPRDVAVAAAKTFWQAAQDIKNEIKISTLDSKGKTKLLACGSINLHGNFFGTRFDIRDDQGHPVQTGCVCLEIARWVLAAFAQHGFEPNHWPQQVRNEIFA